MRSLIVQKIAPLILLVTVVFAIYLLLRGHDAPGGGFPGAIATTLGMLVIAIATGLRRSRPLLEPLIRPAFGVGALLAAGSACAAMVAGEPFFTHFHVGAKLPGTQAGLSTVMLFDLGIYLVVVGATAAALAALAEAARW